MTLEMSRLYLEPPKRCFTAWWYEETGAIGFLQGFSFDAGVGQFLIIRFIILRRSYFDGFLGIGGSSKW